MSTEGDFRDGRDGDDLLVAEYALGLLDAAERERVRRRLNDEPALQQALRDWESRFAGLDAEFAEATPPSGSWSALETRMFGPQKKAGFWDSLFVWRGLAGAALAVAVVAIGFGLTRPAPVSPQQFAVELVAALQAHEGSGVEFVAFYDSAVGQVKLVGLSGAVVPDKDYELWYIDGDKPAISMGVIPVDGKTAVDLPPEAGGKLAEGVTLAVSLEQKGGSPTGVHQGPIVSIGAATTI